LLFQEDANVMSVVLHRLPADEHDDEPREGRMAFLDHLDTASPSVTGPKSILGV
jgi:hypothetical protein